MLLDDDNVNIVSFESRQLSPCDLNSLFKQQYQNTFNISHINIRSLNKNYDSFKICYEELLQSNFHIIGVSEVWHVTTPDLLSLDGYNLELCCRGSGIRGGGVGLYIKSILKYNLLQGNVDHTESHWIESTINKHPVVFFGVVYRKPNTNVIEFQNSLIGVLENFKIYQKQYSSAGAMIAFEIKGTEREAFLFLNNLKLIKLAVSLGSTESLVQHPATMTHAGVSPELKKAIGITEGLIRISIGVENHADLIADITAAFHAVK